MGIQCNKLKLTILRINDLNFLSAKVGSMEKYSVWLGPFSYL